MTQKAIAAPSSPSSNAASAGRVALDSLVQGSVVDLFAAYQVAVAPLPSAPGANWPIPEVSATVFLRSREANDPGRLTLSLPTSLLEQMKGSEPPAVQLDWARELCSQLGGRIKNRLLPFGVRVELGGLSLLNTQVLRDQLERSVGARIYAARTLRGLVLVTLQGLPEASTLTYVGAPSAAEGTLIWL